MSLDADYWRGGAPSSIDLGHRELQAARDAISLFVVTHANRKAAEVGFGWTPDPEAPDRYDALLAAFTRSAVTGEALPISDLFCESTIYTSPEANMAFRFWHDVSHVRRGLTFELVDELELALWHLGELTAGGFGPETVVWKLLQADLVGQIYVMALVHRFPLDQGKFVQSCIESGFDAGVLAECRQSESPANELLDHKDDEFRPVSRPSGK